MASVYLGTESVPANSFPPAPPAAIARVLSRFDRDQLAGFITVAIDLLDLAAGDPDVELNGDEEDGTMGEDDFHQQASDGPGCPLSDPGGCEHDGREIEDGM